MSYPSQKRRLRPARAVAAAVAALMAAGAGLAAMPAAQAVPTPQGPAGYIQTMGGFTYAYSQGGYGPEGVLATESQFQNPRGLNFAPNGDLYVTDALNHRVRKIDANGVVTLVAGDPTVSSDPSAPNYPTKEKGFVGDGISATDPSVRLNEPHGVAVDHLNNVYIADSQNCVIRKVSAGIISTFAGTGQKAPNNPTACGHTDDAQVTYTNPKLVGLDQPKQLFMTQDHNSTDGDIDVLWVTDMGNSMIRRIDIKDGNALRITRVAGTNQGKHYGGDGANALFANLRHSEGIWVSQQGDIYITDGGNNLVRKITKPSGLSTIWNITTIAGDVAAAQANASGAGDLAGNDDGDGGPAINGHLDEPRGITGDNLGNLYVAEEHGSRIRKINLTTGIINTIAGDGTVAEQRADGGTAFIKGENGPALETSFNHLHDIQINPTDGSLWIADSRDNRVRAMFNVAGVTGGNVQTGGNTPPATQPPVQTPSGKSGYWMLGEDGRVYPFGDAQNAMFGDAVNKMPAGAKAMHIEPTPAYDGYWINDDKGNVYAFGKAGAFGNADPLLPGEKLSSLSATPTGKGYWLFTSRGRVFSRGDAGKFGDLADKTLNGPIQSSIPTTTGLGYYMVGSDGGVFAFGDAKYFGSMGGKTLNKPVLALVPTRSSQGYWLVASDGGIFAFGDAGFNGSMGGKPLNKPVVGMVRYGSGYLMTAADGGIFDFSKSPNGFKGSLGANPPARPIVFAATLES